MSRNFGDHSPKSQNTSRRRFLKQSAVVAGTAVGGAIARRAYAEDATEDRDPRCFVAGAAITNLTPDRELPHYYGRMMKPDTTMQYLAFEDRAGTPIAIVINYPCHNNCCGGYYHRDLGGRAGDALRRQLGGRFATPFLAAPCGDVIWFDPRSPRPVRGDELAWQIGKGIAKQIVSSLERSQRRDMGFFPSWWWHGYGLFPARRHRHSC